MRISVIGAGSWGTALARLAALQDHPVRLWAYETEVIESIRVRRVNGLFLPDIELPSSLLVTNALPGTARKAQIFLIAVPSQHGGEVLVKVAPHVPPDALLVSATKGIEEETLLRMSEGIEQVMRPNGESRVVVLSGPTFAREVASDHPTALVAASHRRGLARRGRGGMCS